MAPVFFAALFMVFEASFIMRSYLATSRAGLEGARRISIAAADPQADQRGLEAIRISLGSAHERELRYVIVYKATKPGQAPPAACHSGSVSGVCNRYTPDDLDADPGHFGCGQPLGAAWCPPTRKVGLRAGENGPPDFVGVEIGLEHDSLFGLGFSSLNMSSHSVVRIEPQTK